MGEHLFYYALNLGSEKTYLTEAQVMTVSNAVDLDPSLSVSMFEEDGRLESQKGKLTEILLRRNNIMVELNLSPWWVEYKTKFDSNPSKKTGGMVFKTLRMEHNFPVSNLVGKIDPGDRDISVKSLINMIYAMESDCKVINGDLIRACCSWMKMTPDDASDYIAIYLDPFGLISRKENEKMTHLIIKRDPTPPQKHRSKVKLTDEFQYSLFEEVSRVETLFEMRDSVQAVLDDMKLPECSFLLLLADVFKSAHKGLLSEDAYKRILKHLEFQLKRIDRPHKLSDDSEDLKKESEEGSKEEAEEGNVVALKPLEVE